MKNYIFILYIIIIFFKTGNVLSNNNLFTVNNIEISKEISTNKEELVNQAFKKAFDELLNRILLEDDYKRLFDTNIVQIKKLISYYQITRHEENKITKGDKKINVFFDKKRIHNFFYPRNIFYSDIINTEVILFPLLKKEEQYFIYTQNYFYENWIKDRPDNLIEYILPSENIESIQKINSNKNNIYKLETSDFFKEYENKNVVFAHIEIDKNKTDIFLKTRIEGKKINKNLSIEKKIGVQEENFYKDIILKVDKEIKDLIKSQNLIDVRTPSFLNVKIKLNNKNNLIKFKERLKKIDLINNFYVQQLNKDYVLIKIKYLGKINKIINKLKNENINLIMIAGQWQLDII
jgi:hypothetical protein